ncbi:MAG: Cpe/LpqF family protein, partial [Mycobacterium sp.]
MAAIGTLVAGVTPGCAPPHTPSAHAADTGVRIDIRTPPGLRAQQTLDMLNSDWPIGPIGVRTLAAPDLVEQVDDTMEELWWDRPFTLSDVDISAGAATVALITSYGAR